MSPTSPMAPRDDGHDRPAATPRSSGRDELSPAEIRKDAVQEGVEAAASTVGQVTTIVTGAVRDVARALGGFATELFEIRDSARRAGRGSRDEP